MTYEVGLSKGRPLSFSFTWTLILQIVLYDANIRYSYLAIGCIRELQSLLLFLKAFTINSDVETKDNSTKYGEFSLQSLKPQLILAHKISTFLEQQKLMCFPTSKPPLH